MNKVLRSTPTIFLFVSISYNSCTSFKFWRKVVGDQRLSQGVYKEASPSSRPQMTAVSEEESFYPPLSLVSGACASLLAIINITLICKVSHEFSSTLINKLIFADCLVALLNIPLILSFAIKLSCTFITFVFKFVSGGPVMRVIVACTDTSSPASTDFSQSGSFSSDMSTSARSGLSGSTRRSFYFSSW